MKWALKIIEEIDLLASVSFEGIVSFEYLAKEFKLNERKAIGNTFNRLVIKTKTHLRFITEIPPGQMFLAKAHIHNCMETCKVISGKLADKSLNKKWGVDEVVRYDPFVPHHPYNPHPHKSLILQVDFYKNAAL